MRTRTHRNIKFSNQQSAISNQQSAISNQESGIRNQESGIRNQEGNTAIEYVLLTFFIAIVIYGLLGITGVDLKSVYCTVASDLGSSSTDCQGLNNNYYNSKNSSALSGSDVYNLAATVTSMYDYALSDSQKGVESTQNGKTYNYAFGDEAPVISGIYKTDGTPITNADELKSALTDFYNKIAAKYGDTVAEDVTDLNGNYSPISSEQQYDDYLSASKEDSGIVIPNSAENGNGEHQYSISQNRYDDVSISSQSGDETYHYNTTSTDTFTESQQQEGGTTVNSYGYGNTTTTPDTTTVTPGLNTDMH